MNTRRFIVLLMLALAGCHKPTDDRVQGYAEGEFVYVASPSAGELEALAVHRGDKVAEGTTLFRLESTAEKAARDQAAQRLEEGLASLADAKKGLRATEITSLESQLGQSRAALVLSEKLLARQTELTAAHASSQQDLDIAKATRDQNYNRVAQLEADLETARLGARSDRVAAANANVQALTAALAKAEWELARKSPRNSEAGLIFDTLYQQGEWVPAGRPVIALLPPANIKVRAFVPESRIGTLHVGNPAQVHVDGVSDTFVGKISFIAPQAEYTPPVIYSQDSRQKLVFMVEIRFEPAVAVRLHPGQPVDIQF